MGGRKDGKEAGGNRVKETGIQDTFFYIVLTFETMLKKNLWEWRKISTVKYKQE